VNEGPEGVELKFVLDIWGLGGAGAGGGAEFLRASTTNAKGQARRPDRRALWRDAYDRFKFEAPVRTEGDAYARAWIAYEEMLQSVNIIRQAIEMRENW